MKPSVDKIIALAGNPNVGKSTVFNALTGMKQHTGNWAGKTVELAQGIHKSGNHNYLIVDLPGTYSLIAHSSEEEIARNFICSKDADVVVVVCDATCLERNLLLALQILEITNQVVLCINLMDEAEKKKIKIHLPMLEALLSVPVISVTAKRKKGLHELMEAAVKKANSADSHSIKKASCEHLMLNDHLLKKAELIASKTISYENPDYDKKERKLDQILTNKYTGIPIMLLLFCFTFWLTISGANYPSALLAKLLFSFETPLYQLLYSLHIPVWICELFSLGIYRVLAWVVSVMLPPMAIFFPLFTILEDFGYLPRIAFNLDYHFKKACACGKQALTMCMGFGCNAAGVTGCRIIDSPRERLIAVITNSFVPCNGRFPTLIAIITMFFIPVSHNGFLQTVCSAVLLCCIILLGIFMTFFISRILSKTILSGIPSSFTLELPPYRKPQFGKIFIRPVFDRTLFVLGRAVAVAAPAGLLIWILANSYIQGSSILSMCSSFLDPFARLLGLDGVILIAFVLGFPANEIVVPIMIMIYLNTGTLIEFDNLASLKTLLLENGWTWCTAVCTMLFCLIHWPCSTTCLTIKKETKSLKWTFLSFIIPAITGFIICFLFHTAVCTLGSLLSFIH